MATQRKPWYCFDCDDESRFREDTVCDGCGINSTTLRAYMSER